MTAPAPNRRSITRPAMAVVAGLVAAAALTTAAGPALATPSHPVTRTRASEQVVAEVRGHAGQGRLGRPVRVIAAVLDAEGNRVADTPVTFTVVGKNTASGTGMTNGDGRVAFVYPTEHAGRDHVSITAGGVTGHTTALIDKGVSFPVEYLLSPAAAVVDLGVRARIGFAGRAVAFYRVSKDGTRHRIANLMLGSDGTAAYHATYPSGLAIGFEVRVVPVPHDDYRQYFSAESEIRVH